MKTKLYIAAVIIVTIIIGCCIMAQAGPIRKPPIPVRPSATATNILTWKSLRNTLTTGYVGSNDTVPDPCDQTWTNTLGSYYALFPAQSTVSTAFYCYGDGTGDGDPNAGTFTATTYVVELYGSWELISTATVAVGELELTHNPVTAAEINSGLLDPNESYKWCEGPFTDTLNDSDAWVVPVNLSGVSDGIGRLNVDPLGASGIVVLITNMSGITRVYPIVKGR